MLITECQRNKTLLLYNFNTMEILINCYKWPNYIHNKAHVLDVKILHPVDWAYPQQIQKYVVCFLRNSFNYCSDIFIIY